MTVMSTYAQGINTKNDSLSYAAGMSMTEGLIPYLKQSFNVDTAYMADFVKGFQVKLIMQQMKRLIVPFMKWLLW